MVRNSLICCRLQCTCAYEHLMWCAHNSSCLRD